MQPGNFIKMVISLLCLVGSAGAIYNVNSDVAPLQAQAEKVACPDGCEKLLGLQRSPTSHTFTFQVKVNEQATRIIECDRSLLLFGDYSCTPMN